MGGLLLGIATVGYLYINGRIAGISGLMAQVIRPTKDTFKSSAFWFIAGLVITPFIYSYFISPTLKLKPIHLHLFWQGYWLVLVHDLDQAVQVGMAFVE